MNTLISFSEPGSWGDFLYDFESEFVSDTALPTSYIDIHTINKNNNPKNITIGYRKPRKTGSA